MPFYNKSRGCWAHRRLNMNFTDFITSDEELDGYDSEPEYCLTDSEAEESEEEEFLYDDVVVVNHLGEMELWKKCDLSERVRASTILQKHWRGFLSRH